jgi:hypothetical protein
VKSSGEQYGAHSAHWAVEPTMVFVSKSRVTVKMEAGRSPQVSHARDSQVGLAIVQRLTMLCLR